MAVINEGRRLLSQRPSQELQKRWLCPPSAGSAKRTKQNQGEGIPTHGVIKLVLLNLGSHWPLAQWK